MKQFRSVLYVVLAFAFVLAACDYPSTAVPGQVPSAVPSSTPAVEGPGVEVAATPTTPAPSTPTASPVAGTAVTFDRLSLTLPEGMATGASGTLVPRAEGDSTAPWDIAPEHIQLKLEGYALQGKFLQPQIYVYPAEEYAQLQTGAALSLERLRAGLASGSSAPWSADTLPFVPFFNAMQVFAANVRGVPFQNGQGVRVLTEYAQYAAPVNNNELIYHFEGLTSDGKYYIIAILPVTAPGLPENAQPGAPVPAGGVPVPDLADAKADWPGYYAKVTAMLEALPPEGFSPSLAQLDALIGSLRIAAAQP